VKKIIKDKRLLYKKWQKNGDVRSKELYLTKKKEAKKAVAEARKERRLLNNGCARSQKSSNICM